jgi:hypothetical protein
MPGATASHLHIGSRSEMLADYFFGTFGPVTPVRGHDDYGLDLYCALAERIGQRSIAREYFSVQVKSTAEGWTFKTPDEIHWLLDQTNPILLCVVDKRAGRLEVFHTFGRFALQRFHMPSRLVLRPGTGTEGTSCAWDGSEVIDLSAPIIRASITEFYDDANHEQFRRVLENWLAHERQNLDYRRMGVMRFRMPAIYTTNEPATPSVVETGKYPPDPALLHEAIRRLAEAAECVGDQLRYLRDMKTAVRAALLVDRLRLAYPDAGDVFWRARAQGHLVTDVSGRLAKAAGTFTTEAMDAAHQYLDEHPGVAAAIRNAELDNDPFAFIPVQES